VKISLCPYSSLLVSYRSSLPPHPRFLLRKLISIAVIRQSGKEWQKKEKYLRTRYILCAPSFLDSNPNEILRTIPISNQCFNFKKFQIRKKHLCSHSIALSITSGNKKSGVTAHLFLIFRTRGKERPVSSRNDFIFRYTFFYRIKIESARLRLI